VRETKKKKEYMRGRKGLGKITLNRVIQNNVFYPKSQEALNLRKGKKKTFLEIVKDLTKKTKALKQIFIVIIFAVLCTVKLMHLRNTL